MMNESTKKLLSDFCIEMQKYDFVAKINSFEESKAYIQVNYEKAFESFLKKTNVYNRTFLNPALSEHFSKIPHIMMFNFNKNRAAVNGNGNFIYLLDTDDAEELAFRYFNFFIKEVNNVLDRSVFFCGNENRMNRFKNYDTFPCFDHQNMISMFDENESIIFEYLKKNSPILFKMFTPIFVLCSMLAMKDKKRKMFFYLNFNEFGILNGDNNNEVFQVNFGFFENFLNRRYIYSRFVHDVKYVKKLGVGNNYFEVNTYDDVVTKMMNDRDEYIENMGNMLDEIISFDGKSEKEFNDFLDAFYDKHMGKYYGNAYGL